MHRPLLIDVTRSLQRAARRQPVTGVDRVEVTYVAAWIDDPAARFVALGRTGWREIGRDRVRRLIAEPAAQVTPLRAITVENLRTAPDLEPSIMGLGRTTSEGIHMLMDRYAPASVDLQSAGGGLYLKASHDRLDRPEPYAALAEAGLAQLFFVHDVQPLELPEFFTAGEAGRHRARMATVARHAARVLVNSEDTARRFLAVCRAEGWREPPCAVLPLGVPDSLTGPPAGPSLASRNGHFVMLGTVQPRKNHLLMLQLWHDLAEADPDGVPTLVIIGRRGWLSEPVFRMLRRSPMLQHSVVYAGALDDAIAWAALRGATALLMPSFAEGYALPIAEALALGVPVIASDLPAHREVGGALVTYLDPIDGTGWLAAIREAARTRGPAPPYDPPTWGQHVAALRRLVAETIAR